MWFIKVSLVVITWALLRQLDASGADREEWASVWVFFVFCYVCVSLFKVVKPWWDENGAYRSARNRELSS